MCTARNVTTSHDVQQDLRGQLALQGVGSEILWMPKLVELPSHQDRQNASKGSRNFIRIVEEGFVWTVASASM